MENTKVENDSLIKNGEIILSIGDYFTEKFNKFKSYRCVSIDLHFVTFEKKEGFSQNEIGKGQQFQTVHFIESELDLIKQ